MFANAYGLAAGYTWPVVISARHWDGTVRCSCGAFVILNDAGWVATAAHVLDSFFTFQKHAEEIRAHREAANAIEEDVALNFKQKRKKLGRLAANPMWITNHSFWWGKDGLELRDVSAIRGPDLAIGRLEPFDRTWVPNYPTIKDPTRGLQPGSSLCRLGFPFHAINATFDPQREVFDLPKGTLPIPRFPLEGIYTRNVVLGEGAKHKYESKFLETSSPGLMGQSGGPIFDVRGTVWSIQSKTKHLELGFSPRVRKNGREVEENQFLNVGWGVHPEVLVAFLSDNGINFQRSDY